MRDFLKGHAERKEIEKLRRIAFARKSPELAEEAASKFEAWKAEWPELWDREKPTDRQIRRAKREAFWA